MSKRSNRKVAKEPDVGFVFYKDKTKKIKSVKIIDGNDVRMIKGVGSYNQMGLAVENIEDATWILFK